MAGNEFEKQVQQKMDELKLNPSNDVWNNVEMQINKEKKRRWLLLLLLPLFIFSGGIFWWKEAHQQGNDLLKQKIVAINIANNKNEVAGSVPEEKNKKVIQKQIKAIANSNYIDEKAVNTDKANIESKSTPNDVAIIKNGGRKIIIKNKSKFKTTGIAADQNDLYDSNIVKDSVNAPIAVTDSSKNNPAKKVFVSVDSSKKLEAKKISNIDTIKSNKTLVINDKKRMKKWDLSVQLGLGISATGKGFLSNNNTNSSNGFNAATGANTSAANGQHSPSPAKISYAFKLGLSAMYHISKKLTVSVGLTYKLYSTVIATGSKFVDSNNIASSLYSGGTNNVYHNYYHFIDVPVELQYQIGNNTKLPTYAFAGISLSNLIYTNALQFNYTDGIYYHDNSLFYKTGIGISGGFLVDMFQHKKILLQIGPDFYYGLSNMANSGLYYDKHYSYVGLRFEKIIEKK